MDEDVNQAVEDVGSWFGVPDPADLPEDLQGLFSKAAERLGFVPNVFRAYSFRPERLRAWFTHFRALHEPTEHLDAQRELIAVAVSMANGCLYCLVAHGAALRVELGDSRPGRPHHAGPPHRRPRRAPHRHPRLRGRLTRTPLECGPEGLEHLAAVGLSREEVWDVAEIAAMYNFTNRMPWPPACSPTASTTPSPTDLGTLQP